MKNIEKAISDGQAVLAFLSQQGTGTLIEEGAAAGKDISLLPKECCFFHINELTFEEKAPRREAMENILGTFRDLHGVSFIYLILGSCEGIHFYFGVAKDYAHSGPDDLSAPTVGEDILRPGIMGNFRGCQIRSLDTDEKKAILTRLQQKSYAGILTGIPGTEKDSETFQGVDRLIDVMSEDEFGFMVIARPFTKEETDLAEKQLIKIVDMLSPVLRHSLQRTTSTGKNKNKSESKTEGEQTTDSVQESENTSKNESETKAHNHQKNTTNQQQSTAGQNASRQYSINQNSSRNNNEGTTTNDVLEWSTSRSERPKKTEDSRKDISKSAGNAVGENYSSQHQNTYVFSYQLSEGDNTSNTVQKSKNVGTSISNGAAHTESKNKTTTDAEMTSSGESVVEQAEIEAKSAAQWIKYIDEILLPRIDYGQGKGLFVSCAYLLASQPAILRRLANTAISLYSGPKGNRSPLRFMKLDSKDSACLKQLQNLQIPAWANNETQPLRIAASGWEDSENVYGGSWLSAEELSIIAALPQKETSGLALREEVEFGLNVEPVAAEQRIDLGYLVQDGVERRIPVSIDRSALDKHTFVTGVTGSGKTTTCQNILLNSGLPFLVIEPAKTEYRILKRHCEDLIFFTPGKQDVAPFFLNPFELFRDEAITSRADMIKATLEASFDMEAAIPQIMETAVYRAYEEKGWDVRTNEWRPGGDEPRDPFAEGEYAFPTMSEFWEAVKKVTEEEGFGERLKDEYMGSLKARIESLLVGSKGMMLDTPKSVDFYDLVGKKVVIELEEIKNGAEKSLLMGFILTNLLQAVQARKKDNPSFQHITLVEEAHRLLSRYVPGDSMNKKQGVEVFADMLAEVRKYGESLIIADQIPDKMTPEVLKNTNTKIVHKLFARDDKDAIGDTMALSDDQKAFLAKLPTGRAIVFSQGWAKAIQVKINKKEDTTGQADISAEEIRQSAYGYYAAPDVVRSGVLRGIEHLGCEITAEIISEYLWIMRGGHALKRKYLRLTTEKDDADRLVKSFQAEIAHMEKNVGSKIWKTWLYANVYSEYDEEREKRFLTMLEALASAGDHDARQAAFIRFQKEVLGYLRVV